MRILFLSCFSLTVTALLAGQLSAQHLHRHGDHFDFHQNVPHGHDSAGHLIDNFGHHIDGHGRHTGAYGIFEDGSHGGPWQGHLPSLGYYPSYGLNSFGLNSLRSSYYGAPHYITPYLSSQVYSVPYGNASAYDLQRISTILGSSLMIAPSVQLPPTASGIVTNRIPVPNVGASAHPLGGQVGAAIKLRNPRDSGGSVSYSVNEFSYTINPGETQTIPADRQWTLRFDNGLGKTVAVGLAAGTHYEFVVSQQDGWNVTTANSP